MKKTRFLKAYQYFLLPLYLIGYLGLFSSYNSNYTLSIAESPICSLIIILSKLVYILCIVAMIYLLIRFRYKTKLVYYINLTLLFVLPGVINADIITESVVLCDMHNLSGMGGTIVLDFLKKYAIAFCIYFLPQVIYFIKRKNIFCTTTSED